MSWSSGQGASWFERVSKRSVWRSGRAVWIVLALLSFALSGLPGTSWIGPHATGIVAQGSTTRVFLPFVAAAAAGVDVEVARYGGAVWGHAWIGDYLYLGQGADLTLQL